MRIKIRKAIFEDIDAVTKIYDNIHTEEEKGKVTIGWIRGVYPSKMTAEAALSRGDLFVEEADGKIVGTAIINQTQMDAYQGAAWQYAASDEQVMVLHTLVIDPYSKGSGYGKAFVEYYEKFARQHSCNYLRIDTNELNVNARRFYKKLNYKEVDILPCVFNGIPNVNLVLLEKKLS